MLTDWLQEKNLIEKLIILQNHVFERNSKSNSKYLHGLSCLNIGKSIKITRKYKETSAAGEK